MDDVVFSHVVKRYEDLNGETFNQRERETLKVVHLDEVVQIDAQQFEGQYQVLVEEKVV